MKSAACTDLGCGVKKREATPVAPHLSPKAAIFTHLRTAQKKAITAVRSPFSPLAGEGVAT